MQEYPVLLTVCMQTGVRVPTSTRTRSIKLLSYLVRNITRSRIYFRHHTKLKFSTNPWLVRSHLCCSVPAPLSGDVRWQRNNVSRLSKESAELEYTKQNCQQAIFTICYLVHITRLHV